MYQTRFLRRGQNAIPDRPFNVTSIAQATMGDDAVLYCEQLGGPNRILLTIRPGGLSGQLFDVAMRVTTRQQEVVDAVFEALGRGERPDGSDVVGVGQLVSLVSSEVQDGNSEPDSRVVLSSETVRQEVKAEDGIGGVLAVKDVETSNLFVVRDGGQKDISAWQRTCTYLPKSDLHYADARGRPVDIRWYKLRYTRV